MGAQHPLVLSGAHEPLARGEGAVKQQFEVTELAQGEVPVIRGPEPTVRLIEGGSVGDQVPEFTAMRFVDHRRFRLRRCARAAGRPSLATHR